MRKYNVSRGTVNTWLKHGKVAPIKVGVNTFYGMSKDMIEYFLKSVNRSIECSIKPPKND